MARAVCSQVAAGLQEIQAERQHILSQIRMDDLRQAGQPVATNDLSARSIRLMEQVAALAENAMLHKEMARQCTRVFTWQICSPAMLGTLVGDTWPVFPHFHAAVHEAADMVSCA